MKPTELIRSWVEAFNRADPIGLADFYHPDAINHQIPNGPVQGKEAIKAMFESEFSNAKMTCTIENIFEDGDWGILEWKDPNGLRGCGFFHILEGRIKTQRGYWDKQSFERGQSKIQ